MRLRSSHLSSAFLFSTWSVVLFLVALAAQSLPAQDNALPHLEKRGATTQLIVDGKPFLMLSGELNNSSSSSLDYTKPLWPKLAAMSLNTVITPLSWETIEPTEGKFDFSLVDGLITQAREQNLRVVFLWLATWKNGMSSYAPGWVKGNPKRFPRVVRNGVAIEVLAPYGTATRDADAAAFAALMQHIRELDGQNHTVLMMQVENEVGVLGDTRDYSPEANRLFASAVPAELTQYLAAHKDTLYPDLLALWQEQGEKTSGTWTQVFGDTSRTDEIFMAWNYARFVHYVAAKGKAAYNLPMYANAWLGGDGALPGDYPSGGPQPQVVDIWKAAGSAIDIYSPDLYASEFAVWSKRYHRAGNPLFIPETSGGAVAPANVFYAVGEQAAIGFSPFAIDYALTHEVIPESLPTRPTTTFIPDLGTSYAAIAQLWPLIQDQQKLGNVHGFVLDRGHSSVGFDMNGYVVHVTLDEIFGFHAEKGFGLIIATGPNEFIGAGTGFRVEFNSRAPNLTHVGLVSVDEGRFQNGAWVSGRRLNGDENDQGGFWRFDSSQLRIEKAVVYKYQ
jgi:beta-galactosidase GanA